MIGQPEGDQAAQYPLTQRRESIAVNLRQFIGARQAGRMMAALLIHVLQLVSKPR